MILRLKTINSRQEPHDFFCPLDSIEISFNILNDIVKGGDTLLEAHIIEGQKTIELPVDAFQGESSSLAIQELQQEWEDILNRPIINPLLDHKRELILVIHKRIEILQARSTLYNNTISWFEDFLKQVENDYHYEPQRSKIISSCQEKITNYQTKLVLSSTTCEILKKRFQKLYTE